MNEDRSRPRSNERAFLRLFVAMPVAPVITAELAKTQQWLRTQAPSAPVRWVRPDQIHLTLKYYGDVAQAEVPGLQATLHQALHRSAPLNLLAEHVGCFPNFRQPRVIWAGLTGDLEQLRQTQLAIERATRRWGQLEEDRPFVPHLTLGRIKNARADELEPLLHHLRTLIDLRWGSWPVPHLDLMQSVLSPHGPTYTILDRFPLIVER